MRLLVTADLHYNHARSKPLAIDLIDRMNRAGGDALLVVGDTATADGDDLEQCLARFTLPGPKLFLCGNHELWTRGPDSYGLFTHDLPRRVRALGWQWLETDPFVTPQFAVVGTIGWYDYSLASPRLAIPRRFYEAKCSPGAAEYLKRADLLAGAADVTPDGLATVARWNDGKFVKLHRTDDAFLGECVARLEAQLAQLAHVPDVVVATHHLPFRDLLPPTRYNQLDFAKAYLGSDRLGQAIARFPNVRRVYCGHSHFPARATIGLIDAINLGSSYRWKTFDTLDLPNP
jgi:predicted phosphohydrolase